MLALGAVVPHFPAACLAACTAWSLRQNSKGYFPVTSPVAGLVTEASLRQLGTTVSGDEILINFADICIFSLKLIGCRCIVERSTRVQDRFEFQTR